MISWTVAKVAAAVTAVLVVGVLVAAGLGLIPRPSDLFRENTVDRSKPVVLQSIHDLHRFVGATGGFQVVLDIETDRENIPSFIYGTRVLFVANGEVEAYVELSGLAADAVTIDGDSATIRLPAPALSKPNIDHAKSYVFSEKRGVVNFFQDLLKDEPNRVQDLNLKAEQKILDAAAQSELTQRARTNVAATLSSLIKSLGYATVTIEFSEDPA